MRLRFKLKYLLIAVVLYMLAASLHVGYVHADEYYQVFQFAAVKLGLHVLSPPWEYRDAMRSGLLPAYIIVVYKFYSLFQRPDPFIMGYLMRIVASTISLSSLVIMLQVFLPTVPGGLNKKYLSLLAFFTLAGMYFNVHLCSENISGSFFLIAFSLLFAKMKREFLRYFLVGIFFSLSFTSRFQCGFLIIGALAWLLVIKRLELKFWIILLLSLLLGVLLFNIVLDYWFYGAWKITAWSYLKQNIFLNKVNGYGVEPWYYYLYMGATILPFGLFYVLACLICFVYKPRDLLTWSLVPFIVIHSLIGHKEIRFMAPIINLMPLCLIYAAEILSNKFNFSLFSWRKTIKALWIINCLTLIVMAVPPTTELPVAHYIYATYKSPTDYYFLTYGGSDVDFYKRQNLLSHKIDSLDQIKCYPGRPCVVALTCGQARQVKLPFAGKEVYTQCPEFIYKFNYTNWIDRTAIYRVYQLN